MYLGAGVEWAAVTADTEALLRRLAERQRGPHRHRQPVAMIGPGDADAAQCGAARAIAHALAAAGMAIVCGGRGGVMEAAARGGSEAGGTVIGILPEDDARAGNAWLGIALPTGMGEMRNALIARCGVCLVAVGGGMGTVSEMALGLKWGKPVFVLDGDVPLPGCVPVADVDAMVAAVARFLVQEAPGAPA